MASQEASFFSLPLELRQQIYSMCVDERLEYKLRTLTALGAVNRQIRLEIVPLILDRDHSFLSVNDLIAWIAKASPPLLQYIKNIHLYTTAQDLQSLVLDALITNPTSDETCYDYTQQIMDWLWTWIPGAPDSPAGYDQQRMITRSIEAVFSSFPHLHSFWLNTSNCASIRNPSQKGLILNDFLLAFAKSTPFLQNLWSFTHLTHLDYLTHLRNLRSLTWTGYSLSSPQDTLRILGDLPYLDSMSLFRHPEVHDKDYDIVTAELYRYQSFTADVLRGMRPLKSFEITHLSSTVNSDLLTKDMMDALLTRHNETLIEIRVESDRLIDQGTFTALLKVISGSRLKKLRLICTILEQGGGFQIEDFIAPSVRQPEIKLFRPGLDRHEKKLPYSWSEFP